MQTEISNLKTSLEEEKNIVVDDLQEARFQRVVDLKVRYPTLPDLAPLDPSCLLFRQRPST